MRAGRWCRMQFSCGLKIVKQMRSRNWTYSMIQEVLENPVRTVESRDTRFDPKIGACHTDPATAFYHKDGGYVVRNDQTGDIVQVSDRNDPDWIAPWDV
jgi:Colicin E5 ribonuclease domain